MTLQLWGLGVMVAHVESDPGLGSEQHSTSFHCQGRGRGSNPRGSTS